MLRSPQARLLLAGLCRYQRRLICLFRLPRPGTIKDYNGWQNWHPAIASTEISKGKANKGTVRVLTTKDGAKIKEELLAHSDKSMSYKYRIIDSPLPVTNYVFDDQGIEVQGRFRGGVELELQVERGLSGIYTAGLENLKSILK